MTCENPIPSASVAWFSVPSAGVPSSAAQCNSHTTRCRHTCASDTDAYHHFQFTASTISRYHWARQPCQLPTLHPRHQPKSVKCVSLPKRTWHTFHTPLQHPLSQPNLDLVENIFIRDFDTSIPAEHPSTDNFCSDVRKIKSISMCSKRKCLTSPNFGKRGWKSDVYRSKKKMYKIQCINIVL